ncbi:alpha-L-fucosidase [Gaoshiqia sediminis]|uniref:alpha-L-fucosidase n=1 Tax=Gaoshiqia sediminis TaxID=2986998 RepID=A0AA41YF21_9BACT|nr:alpha-L-fucosidase [Gaoshiqia sediminis]MCW0484887.1 alpha-L-fucosidase [Gaoshiqia sediminis]
MYKQNVFFRFGQNVWIFLIGLSLLSACRYGNTEKYTLEAESAQLVGKALKIVENEAGGGYFIRLTKSSDGVKFTGLSAASKLAIRYATEDVGTISIAVNNEPVQKVNVHSSGSFESSFLNAIIDLEIPDNAELTISMETGDVAITIDRITVGNGDLGLPPDIWNLPPLPVASGPYLPDWKEISQRYTVPEWWREAKLGAWSHWDPQSMPEQGDWYAKWMYVEGSPHYEHHLEHFGHPSEYGYKDICHNWEINQWNPNELMDLYVEMGARYFMAMGVHHDNFDCYDSKYQPWNSVNMGPKVDIVGTWEKIAREHGMRFGIGFHNTPARTWGQFMPVRYTSDRTGPMQGVPYDALQTVLDGKGKWWERMDPVDLYGPVHDKKDPLLSPFANQFMWRVDDAITKYRPDVIYFDEHAGDSQMDLGVRMGLGFLAPQLIANYYNKAVEWNDGETDVVVNLKGVGGRWNSFQNDPDLLPHVDRSLVKSTEEHIEPEIMAYPFQTESCIAVWHYKTGQEYKDAKNIINSLMENVCRNGTMLLDLTQRGRGNLDPEVVRIAKDVGAWMKVNGEAIYGSRPFEVYGEGNVRYTRRNGNVYATIFDWSNDPLILRSLHSNSATIGKISKVELIGSNLTFKFVQDDKGLTITPNQPVEPLPEITDQSLASGYRVLRITHDKGWINDDDPGTEARGGWLRCCNLGTGDFNNDITFSETPGDMWSCSFTGSGVSVIAPKEPGAGKIEIQIDGKSLATIDLSIQGKRQAQQIVYEVNGLTPGEHHLKVVNLGFGAVAIDAIVVQ